MGYASGGFGFHTEFRARPDKIGTWRTDTVVNDVLLAPVREAGDLAHATHFSCNRRDPVPISSPEQLAREAAKWRDEAIEIYAGSLEDPAWLLHIRLDRSRPSIGLGVSSDLDSQIRERYATWVQQWCHGLANVGCDLSVGYMEPRRPYTRPRPPREGTAWPLGTLDLYLGGRWHAADERRRAVLARITEAALAPDMRRMIDDDVVRIAFDCDLRDDAAVERTRIAGERWLTPLVPTRVEPGWNELGDQMIVPSTPIDRAPFTFYDETEHVGYWALIRDPEDGSIDEARWHQLSAIARAGALDDGSPVKSVRLIVPVREDAVALLERAAADGFEMVTYPEGNGAFWQVFEDAAVSS